MASGQVTQLLVAWAAGNEAALDPLMTLVYDELHRIARRHVARERAGVLQATALVHEPYLRLIDQTTSWQNRAHFFAIAAQMMRRILVDHAQARQSARRGGGAWHLSLGHADVALERAADVVALDDALSELAAVDPRKSRVVELRASEPPAPRRENWMRKLSGVVQGDSARRRLRHEAGVTPVTFLKARQKAASDS
jgi:RNA polymerase sigma-70 factor, ECF subfamily